MKRKRAVRLEMTALMDVMFLVLVFFIYCVFEMSVHRGVKVDLPEAEGALQKGERIVITIRPDNSLQLNGLALSREDVVARVKAVRGTGLPFPVIISGDRAARLGTGVELLAALKAAGIEKVSFQVTGEK